MENDYFDLTLAELESAWRYAEKMYKSYLGKWQWKSDEWFEKRRIARENYHNYIVTLGWKREPSVIKDNYVPMSEWTEKFEEYEY